MDQQISRLDTNTNDSGQQPNHGVGPALMLLLQSFLASFLDLSDLADDKAQPRHVALQLGQGVWRQRRALRGVHGCQTLGRLAQGRFEVANPQPGKGGLYPVDDPRAFPHQAVALAVRPLASSSAIVGTRAMLQWPRSPRSHPKKARFSNSVSSRSVFARRCSRDTATLEGWITCASTPRAFSQRANQKPSRPASKASAIRVIFLPA